MSKIKVKRVGELLESLTMDKLHKIDQIRTITSTTKLSEMTWTVSAKQIGAEESHVYFSRDMRKWLLKCHRAIVENGEKSGVTHFKQLPKVNQLPKRVQKQLEDELCEILYKYPFFSLKKIKALDKAVGK